MQFALVFTRVAGSCHSYQCFARRSTAACHRGLLASPMELCRGYPNTTLNLHDMLLSLALACSLWHSGSVPQKIAGRHASPSTGASASSMRRDLSKTKRTGHAYVFMQVCKASKVMIAGPPGCGKGTQCAKIVEKVCLPLGI